MDEGETPRKRKAEKSVSPESDEDKTPSKNAKTKEPSPNSSGYTMSPNQMHLYNLFAKSKPSGMAKAAGWQRPEEQVGPEELERRRVRMEQRERQRQQLAQVGNSPRQSRLFTRNEGTATADEEEEEEANTPASFVGSPMSEDRDSQDSQGSASSFLTQIQWQRGDESDEERRNGGTGSGGGGGGDDEMGGV
ncbi:hypothetical protein PRZ48_003288 [Zasmidium cellare]|uniref:Uncharacterized protein n=1 Tax=Zasmidium cellare TaxID=395010 RepID=A0ABR0EV59_ZASCE|nr:hypothetical protein PRZ48_003288 [Zasmidium cellare]